MAANWSIISSIIFIFLFVTVETKPSNQRDDKEALRALFGPRLSSLILAPPTPDDITEGSGGASRAAALGLVGGRREAVPRLLLDFLQRQTLTRRRGRKSMVGGGGRGCFGVKLDRIGSASGLGC